MLAKNKKINKSSEESSSTFGVVKDRKTKESSYCSTTDNTKYKPVTEATDRLPVIESSGRLPAT